MTEEDRNNRTDLEDKEDDKKTSLSNNPPAYEWKTEEGRRLFAEWYVDAEKRYLNDTEKAKLCGIAQSTMFGRIRACQSEIDDIAVRMQRKGLARMLLATPDIAEGAVKDAVDRSLEPRDRVAAREQVLKRVISEKHQVDLRNIPSIVISVGEPNPEKDCSDNRVEGDDRANFAK